MTFKGLSSSHLNTDLSHSFHTLVHNHHFIHPGECLPKVQLSNWFSTEVSSLIIVNALHSQSCLFGPLYLLHEDLFNPTFLFLYLHWTRVHESSVCPLASTFISSNGSQYIPTCWRNDKMWAQKKLTSIHVLPRHSLLGVIDQRYWTLLCAFNVEW